jgi:hypothetical protein
MRNSCGQGELDASTLFNRQEIAFLELSQLRAARVEKKLISALSTMARPYQELRHASRGTYVRVSAAREGFGGRYEQPATKAR